MKNLKIVLLGLFVFVTPLLFYMQALQIESERKRDELDKSVSESSYLQLYKLYIRDSLLLEQLKNKAETTQKAPLKGAVSLNNPVLQTSFPSKVPTLRDLSLDTDSKLKNDSTQENAFPIENTFYEKDVTSLIIIGPDDVEKIIPKEKVKNYSTICIHVQVDHMDSKSMYLNFPYEDLQQFSYYFCSDFYHRVNNVSTTNEKLIHSFHSKNPNPGLKLYAICFPKPVALQNKIIDVEILDSEHKEFSKTPRRIIVKFQ